MITIDDVKGSITKLIKKHSNLSNYNVYNDFANTIIRPAIHISVDNYNVVFDSQNRERKIISLDIICFAKGVKSNEPTMTEIYPIMHDLNYIFEDFGKKVLTIDGADGDKRVLYIKNANINVVERVIHFTFKLDFFDTYFNPATRVISPMMQNMGLKLNYWKTKTTHRELRKFTHRELSKKKHNKI